MPIPKLAANEIIDRLNALMDEERPSEIALAQLRGMAQKLVRGNHAAAGYAALGMVATVAFDPDAVISAFRNSLRLEHDPVTAENFAISLDRVGKLELAADVSAETARRHPDSIDAVSAALRQALFVFRLSDVDEFMQRLKKLGVNVNGSEHAGKASDKNRGRVDYKDFSDFIARAEAVGITQRDLSARAECAALVLADKRVVARGINFGFVPGGALAYLFSVRRSVDEATELSWRMAEGVVSRFDTSLSDWVTFSVLSEEKEVVEAT